MAHIFILKTLHNLANKIEFLNDKELFLKLTRTLIYRLDFISFGSLSLGEKNTIQKIFHNWFNSFFNHYHYSK